MEITREHSFEVFSNIQYDAIKFELPQTKWQICHTS